MLMPLCFNAAAARTTHPLPASPSAAQTGSARPAGAAEGPGAAKPSAVAAGLLVAVGGAVQRRLTQRRRPRGPTARRAEAKDAVVSPFAEEAKQEKKPKLPLTWENVELILDELRPYLQSDGGDCKIVEIDGPIVRLELQGSCSSCSSSAVTLKMGIEKTLLERIPEIAEVTAVMPDQEPLTQEAIEEVLNGIRPFLSVSGGSITLGEMIDPEGEAPRVVLEMAGPPLKSMAVRVEVVNRIKRKFPHCQEVDIVAAEGEEVTSA